MLFPLDNRAEFSMYALLATSVDYTYISGRLAPRPWFLNENLQRSCVWRCVHLDGVHWSDVASVCGFVGADF